MDQFQNNVQHPVTPNWSQPQVYQPTRKPEDMLPTQYKPLGAWEYFGYSLLFAIPLVGFILLIVFSFNDTNINRRNFARSYWCMLAVAVVIGIIVAILGIATGTMFYRFYRLYG